MAKYLEKLHKMSKSQNSIARDWEDAVACVASHLPLDKVWISIDVYKVEMELEMLKDDGDYDNAWLYAYEIIFDPLYQYLAP